MPYLTQPRSRTLISGGGDAAPATSSPGAPAPSAAAPSQGSGAFTDFSAYLSANGDQSKALADKITAPIGAQAEAASHLTAPELPDSSLRSLEAGTGASAILNGQRTGARNQLASDPLPNAFDGNGPGYTPGMQRLDTFLAGGPVKNDMDQLRQKYAGLLGPLTPKYGTPPPASSVPAAEGGVPFGDSIDSPGTYTSRGGPPTEYGPDGTALVPPKKLAGDWTDTPAW